MTRLTLVLIAFALFVCAYSAPAKIRGGITSGGRKSSTLSIKKGHTTSSGGHKGSQDHKTSSGQKPGYGHNKRVNKKYGHANSHKDGETRGSHWGGWRGKEEGGRRSQGRDDYGGRDGGGRGRYGGGRGAYGGRNDGGRGHGGHVDYGRDDGVRGFYGDERGSYGGGRGGVNYNDGSWGGRGDYDGNTGSQNVDTLVHLGKWAYNTFKKRRN